MATFRKINETTGIETLRTYQHAKKIFVDSNYRLSPKYGFLFYVEFDFNPMITSLNNVTAQEMGMVVKSVNLPSFAIDVKAHNAYNRKNYVQNSIKYDPVTITFHDDQSDNVLNFWYDYYSYYYRDSDYNDSTYSALHKYQSRPAFDWGYSPRAAIGYNGSNGAQPYQYIQAIRLYTMYQSQFDQYELINPIITNFKHGELSNESGNMLQHEMSIQFETVKYLTGAVTKDTVGGYINLQYDLTPSPNLDVQEKPAYETNTHEITDFANKSNTNALAVNQALFSTALPASTSAASALAAQANLMAGALANNGGMTIPALGSLTAGVTNSNVISQNLASQGVAVAGSSMSNGITNGLQTSGQGGAIIGLAAQAMANPSATLHTIENMATSVALGLAVNSVTNLVSMGTQALGNEVASVGNQIADSAFVQTMVADVQGLGSDISGMFNLSSV